MSNELIREVEATVLDRYHLGFELFRLPDETAIARLLKVFGDLHRDFQNDLSQSASEHGRSRFVLNKLFLGLCHALRWVAADAPPGIQVETTDWRGEDEKALACLQWSIQYASLATDHVAWSNRLIHGTADPNHKVIAFDSTPGMSAYFIAQSAAERRSEQRRLDDRPNAALDELFNAWVKHARWKRDGLDFPPQLIVRNRAFANVVAWSRRTMMPELPDSFGLNGYTIGEMRTFAAGLYANMHCIAELEDSTDRAEGLINSMGSWMIQLPVPELVHWLSVVCAMKEAAVEAIVHDFVLDTSRFHCTLLAQPIVRAKSGLCTLLARLIVHMDLQRLIVNALLNGSGRKYYDTASTAIEKVHVRSIAQALRRTRAIIRCEVPLAAGGTKIKPDFLLFDQQDDALLVIDYKNLLVPGGPAALNNRLKEIAKAIAQVSAYQQFCVANRSVIREVMPEVRESTKVFGLMLHRSPMPVPLTPPSDPSVVDWFSLDSWLERNRGASCSALLDWVKRRPDADARPSDVHRIDEEILVGGWTYRRSFYGHGKPKAR